MEIIDIANDKLADKKFSVDHEDPTKVTHSKANNRRKGPLSKTWIKEIQENPSGEIWMCCYKLVTVKFQYFGFASRVESRIYVKRITLFFVDR